jgi:hypothetical protein
MVELGHGYLRTAIKDLKAAKTNSFESKVP